MKFIFVESGPTGINLPYLSVAASIKLLMAVPERIWAAVEDQQLTQVWNCQVTEEQKFLRWFLNSNKL